MSYYSREVSIYVDLTFIFLMFIFNSTYFLMYSCEVLQLLSWQMRFERKWEIYPDLWWIEEWQKYSRQFSGYLKGWWLRDGTIWVIFRMRQHKLLEPWFGGIWHDYSSYWYEVLCRFVLCWSQIRQEQWIILTRFLARAAKVELVESKIY